MNKRNTLIASIVLLVLIALLVGRSVFRHRLIKVDFNNEERVECLRDLNLSTGFDSATMEACDLPIVFHYPKPVLINGSYVMNHVVGVSLGALLDIASPDSSGSLMPDSTSAIHVYPVFRKSKSSTILLGVYSKITMTKEVEYRFTYPVEDSLGASLKTGSGRISAVSDWKYVGVTSVGKFKKESEEKMSKQVEYSMINDLAKKMIL